MQRLKVSIVLCIAAAATLVVAGNAVADHPGGGGVKLSATLTGAEECNAQGVCNQGDPDGTGTFSGRVNVGQRELCYTLTVANIAPATAAHIHVAPRGRPGPVVIGLAPPTNGSSSGCITGLDRGLLKAIVKNPEQYYVNVHNAPYPAGALRGQLSR